VEDLPEIDRREVLSTFEMKAFTNDDKRSFCEAYADGIPFKECCELVGINRTTFLYHRKQDQVFASMLEACREIHCDDLESVMLATGRSPKGVADRLAYLKAYRPAFNSKDSSPSVNVNINISDEKLREYAQPNDGKRTEVVQIQEIPPMEG